ncbi:hypothetical protein [Nonomuraea dietziae]|uniref:hypothetical protein n=1 Tax=Nonomuraea dietziae TaxID=65515 RepID=UPI0031D13620
MRARGDGADALICLGDLILFIGLRRPRAGDLPSCSAPTRPSGSSRCAPPSGSTRPGAMSARLWASLEGDSA